MPLDNQRDNSAAAPSGEPKPTQGAGAPGKRLRRFTRRHAVISGIIIAAGVIALILIGLLAYRLGFVDRYVTGQIKNTLAKYGIRAEIRDFHTSLSPQTVEMLGVELYDAKTGEKLGTVDRLLATVRVEDLYALNLHRDINLQDLKIEGLELWVKFDAQGQSNFHNLHIPPPEPNSRILFAYSAAHIELKNGLIHYGDELHSLTGDARNIHVTLKPEDPNAPMGSRTGVFTFTSSNSTFVYDQRPVNNIDIEARGRINETLADIQELVLRSPVAEAHLQGVMDDWRALKYHFNVTSTVDLSQASDILQTGTAMRGVGNFVGTITGDGNRFQVDGSIKSDALAADGVRLQGLNLTAKGSGQGKSYDINGRAVAELLTAGDFQLNAVQLTGGVMGTGSDFRWVGELRAAAEKSYGTTITGLILRDARAEYRDGVLTASAPQFTGSSLTSSTAKVREGIQASDLRVKVEKNGTTTATIASAKAGKIEAANTTVNGVTAATIDIKSNGPVTNVNVTEVQVGEANAFGAQTGSINIAGVRLTIRGGRVEGSTNDINAGTVTLKDGRVENVKLARPVFTVEPSGRYRASADLSLGGGVLGQMKLGPAHAAVVATSDQIQLNNFAAEALDGNAGGNAAIALKRNGASRINANFNNFDLAGLITVLSGRVIPIASKATGKAELSFSGTDLATASGNVNAQLKGELQAGSDLAPLSGDLALTADHGQFQIQRVNLQTTATRLTATGQFSIDEPTSNLRIDLASSDAAELQRLLINSGVIPEIEEQFRTYGIDLGGKLAFNGTLNGALKDPTVSGHAELGSLTMNGRDLGSLAANLSSTATETRISEGRLTQANGGGARFAMVVPRAGKDNISIDATLDRMNAGNLIAALPKTDLRQQLGDTEADVSGTLKISGAPNQMSGVADLRFGPGRLGGEPLQDLTAHATFSGSTVNLDKVDVNFNAGHLVASGKFDTQTKVFDLLASGDRVQLDRLAALTRHPELPKFSGTAVIKELKASGVFTDLSTYQISFDAASTDVTIDGDSAGSVTLVGRTENKQLSIKFTTTGLLGPRPQIVTAQVVLSNEKLPAVIESTITGADLTQLFTILLPQTDKVVTGRATGALKLSGNLLDEDGYFTWQGLTGNATITELSVKVEEVTLSAAGPLVIDVAPNEVNFHETRFTGQDTNVTLRGAVATAAGGSNTLTVNGRVNLQLFSGVPSRDVFSSGEAELAINVSGTFEERRVTGTARLNAATISVLVGDQRLTLSNLAGVIRFAPVRLKPYPEPTQVQAQIESLTGILGGGKVRASGGALLEGFSLSRFLFNVHGENVTVDYPQDFRSTVTADLELRGDRKDQFISGVVNVHRTEYTKDIELADLINRRPAPSIEEGGEFQFSQTANFDKLRVEGRNALIMRNNLGNLVASVSLQLNGPIKDPIIEGRITATRGTLNFRNNPYEITRGLIYFPPRLGADPILNIEAQAVIRGYRLTALLEGPLSHPQTNVSAEPSLPQADVVSLMLTGTLSSTETSTSVLAQSGLGTAASLLTDALINAPISKATNKLFGLSRLEISPVIGGTGSTPTARLTAARRISKDIVVTYSTNIASDPNQVLAVEYRVSNRLSFVAQYEQGSTRNLSTRSNNYGFEIRFRKRF